VATESTVVGYSCHRTQFHKILTRHAKICYSQTVGVAVLSTWTSKVYLVSQRKNGLNGGRGYGHETKCSDGSIILFLSADNGTIYNQFNYL